MIETSHLVIGSALLLSMMHDETDKSIKKIWERLFEQELTHLHEALKLLRKYEKKDWSDVIPEGYYPELISFHSNKEYVRGVLGKTVHLTADREKKCYLYFYRAVL